MKLTKLQRDALRLARWWENYYNDVDKFPTKVSGEVCQISGAFCAAIEKRESLSCIASAILSEVM